MPFLLFLACAYDMESWQSPLAKGFEGVADPEEGERIFNEEHWEDKSIYSLSCARCHSASEADSLTVDEGDLQHPGHTVYNAAWRGSWKNGEKWSMAKSDTLGGFGGQICVTVYFGGDSAMTAEQAAHLEAWLKTRTDAEPSEGDPRAQPIGVEYSSWDTQSTFLSSIAGKVGEELGSVENGELLAGAYCGSCHRTGAAGELEFYTASLQSAEQLAARIRRASVNGDSAPNRYMPRIPEDRLLDEDLKDILAFLTSGR